MEEVAMFIATCVTWTMQLLCFLLVLGSVVYWIALGFVFYLGKKEERIHRFDARQYGETEDTGSNGTVQLQGKRWREEAHNLAEKFCGIRSVRRPWWKFWSRMD